MDTFVNMRKFINNNKDVYKSINNKNNKLKTNSKNLKMTFT